MPISILQKSSPIIDFGHACFQGQSGPPLELTHHAKTDRGSKNLIKKTPDLPLGKAVGSGWVAYQGFQSRSITGS